ncbi:hypothetical protein GKG47_16035 [Lactonifactor sp. BIOML-A3]|uniref:CpsB/CapC family capsule biosynthesis tyrosine phosphatase n=1 Tax=Lactonifactor TaxID=420345 RepID=UPI0012AF3A16|nr:MULTISPECIES: CpsB/CapC family capsule biosynthesis tyrosine phosphatase [Lactonifactor]MCB5714527.1 hypothetical protein [Lactonifactor longoviformis]MCB5718481.1 hypothetical protein [Lactonifactor longoviformis]MSA01666.1 hypothetical protein [Lactonifactor sp. BIOML-A5]MSA08664.1 hypothetical protein [Lactonifactor sp. BIOML-A4]MSA13940.1 hypothetical protein [Lactonifactor sp. BIOML-A3]
MLIDVHNHILPGIDDGAGDIMESQKMLAIAVSEKIDAIITTPHFECGMDQAVIEKRAEAFESLSQYIQKAKLPVALYPGNELFYSEGIIDALDSGDALTLNHTRYVLVEFPIYEEFSYIRRAVQKLRYAGYLPVLAHVERYENLLKEEKIAEIVNIGAYIQVNASSLTGRAGWQMRRFLLRLARRDLIHFIGTDAHGWEHRRPKMQECLAYLEKKAGKDCVRSITRDNPEKLLRGENISGEVRN